MVDIATVWNQDIGTGDYEIMPTGALRDDQDLATAVYLSLMTDRTAHVDDHPPDGGGRRGWWGDAYRQYPLGSRLWLLSREKETEETRARAEMYGRESLAWMIKEGVASQTLVTARWVGPGHLELTAIIVSPTGSRAGWRYALAWGQLVGMERITGVII